MSNLILAGNQCDFESKLRTQLKMHKIMHVTPALLQKPFLQLQKLDTAMHW